MIASISWHCRLTAMNITPQDDTAIISISRPGDVARLKDGWKHKLILEFHDVGANADTKRHTPFDSQMAERILAFTDSIRSHVRHIHVHCFAGISRSPAVAKFISERYGLDCPRFAPFMNRHVYCTLKASEAKSRQE